MLYSDGEICSKICRMLLLQCGGETTLYSILWPMLGYFVFIQALQELVRHHIESFNFMVDEGLSYAVQVILCVV